MKMLDLVTYLRTNLLDDTGGQGVDWTTYSDQDQESYQLRWSNEELVANINEAINQVYRRILPVKDIVHLKVITGKEVYNLPTYLLSIIQIRTEQGNPLKEVNIEDVWYSKSNNKRIEPTEYTSDYLTGTLRVYPTPLKDNLLSLLIYRLPKESKSLYDSDDIDLRDEFNLPMLYYAASLCYMKDEANILDPNRANYFMSLFDREFPFTSAYSSLRKSRTANRSIKYGGL